MSQQYYYYKTINNNAIIALNKHKHETILFGKGIGIKCNRTLNSLVDSSLIERVFVAQGNFSYLEQLLQEIPYEYFDLVKDILEVASQRFDQDFTDTFYFALLDHIYFAQKMLQEGQSIINPLLSEIKMFHHREFDVAMEIIQLINQRLHTHFDQNEAAYIAFHFVTAMSNLNQSQNKKLIAMLNETLRFISSLENINLDENSYYYGRLISHIKYFLIRKLENKAFEEKEVMSPSMMESICQSHSYEWKLAEKIKDFFEHEFQLKVSQQECAYLTLHIVPIISRKGE